MTRADYDFVLGSVHWVDEFGPYWADSNRLSPTYPAERLFELYYLEVLKAARFGGFDSLAHIDFPKRYLLRKYEPVGILNEIMTELTKRHIALELNSQPIRKRYSEINPSATICSLYSKAGGSVVTTGSDAHAPEDIGGDFDSLESTIRGSGFKPVYFVKRKECVLTGIDGQNSGLTAH